MTVEVNHLTPLPQGLNAGVFFWYTDPMSEREHRPPEEAARHAVNMAKFLLKHRDALRALLHGNLFKPVPGSTAWRGKEWRNVADHCIAVARALDALGGLLGMSVAEREALVKVGLVHDWNKRLTKNPEAFSDDEKAKAEATAKEILATHDPDGRLIDATEPHGMARLEGDAATLAEHCLHFIDLNCTSDGLVGPEERFKDLKSRHAKSDEMWKRKEALVAKEEAMFLEEMRRKGMDVPAGTRLHDLLKDAIAKA